MAKLLLLCLLTGVVAAEVCQSGTCESPPVDQAQLELQEAEEVEALRMELLQTKADINVLSVSNESVVKTSKQQAHAAGQPAQPTAAPVDETTLNPDALPDEGSAAGATGVTLNAEGDLDIALASLVTYGLVTVPMMVGMFMFFKTMFPKVYMNNVFTGSAPYNADTMPTGLFGWVKASLSLTVDQMEDAAGLDAAMLIEFCHLSMKILGVIAIPILLIEAPMNLAFGGYAAGLDYLSYLSFGNVANCQDIPGYTKTYNEAFDAKMKEGPCTSWWLYYVHALVIWVVVFTVQQFIYRSQRNFLQLRYRWLAKLPSTRAKTILVENIPAEAATDEELKKQFISWFSEDKIESAYVVKDTAKLVSEINQKTAAVDQKKKLEANATPSDKDKIVISQLETDIAALTESIAKEQSRIKWFAASKAERQAKRSALAGPLKQPENPDEACEVNCTNGFVTFKQRTDAEIALNLQYAEDQTMWTVSTPPDVASLRWQDLQQDPTAQQVRTFVGYCLVAGLYVAYLPLVIQITNLANTVDMGALQPVWAGVAPTLGLQIMVAFLPTFLIFIFCSCFTLKADVWGQKMLQNWYFAFQVVFVVLVTAIGGSVVEFTQALLTSPFEIFNLLATTMPAATHFYMNFMMMQWSTHATNMARMVNLFKFNTFKRIYDEDEAVQKAEPEDQDYYGMGSRCARFTINMAVAIVYGTLSPPIIALTFVNFALCRLFYGYLLVFAETKKADTGGTFWVSQLTHLFDANIIYCIVMIGVLMGRAETSGPSMIVMPTLIYVISSKRRFNEAFSWEKLPFSQISAGDQAGKPGKQEKNERYIQPELAY